MICYNNYVTSIPFSFIVNKSRKMASIQTSTVLVTAGVQIMLYDCALPGYKINEQWSI